MDRNLALEFVRVTEAAAIASARWMGKGDKHKADEAAVKMMRKVMKELNIDGKIVIAQLSTFDFLCWNILAVIRCFAS